MTPRSCPPQFNLTVDLPPRGPPQSNDRTLEVVLHDSKVEQRVFLTTLVERNVERRQRRPTSVDDRLQSAGNTSLASTALKKF